MNQQAFAEALENFNHAGIECLLFDGCPELFYPETNTSTMQLVKTEAHEATVPHKGSVSQFETAHGVKYELKEAKAVSESCNAEPKK